jgi:Flp pilus assembly protein TadB
VTGAEDNPLKGDLAALSGSVLPDNVTPVTLDIDGLVISVLVPTSATHTVRQTFKELARREKRRAADAGNAASTGLLVCGSIGAPLATSGIVALATSSSHWAVADIVVTGFGGLIALAGLIWSRRMNNKKFTHEERLERYLEVIEDMK